MAPKEARRRTGVSLEELARLARAGSIGCLYGDGEATNPTAYLSEDVQELRWLRGQKLTLPVLHRACREARLSAKRALQEVKRLQTVLGIQSTLQDISAENVVLLYKEAAEMLVRRTGESSYTEIYTWGARLLGMDEAFFHAVRLHVIHSMEPWEIFLKTGEYLLLCARHLPKEPMLAAAVGYLEAGMRNVRTQAVLGRGNKTRAEEEELLALVRELSV